MTERVCLCDCVRDCENVCLCDCVRESWTDCVRSGELLGRTFFLKTSIQFLRMPAVMAESVKTASLVCRTHTHTHKRTHTHTHTHTHYDQQIRRSAQECSES